MRDALRSVGTPEHLELAYDAWAPSGPGGKVPDSERSEWLGRLASLAVSPDYAISFERWKSSFGMPGDRVFELELAGRLLIGHGNASAADVGLTVHHTWGVPVIPGTALKGLLAHYVDAVYGPDDRDRAPWEQPLDGRERARYQGVTWSGRRILRGPGDVYRGLFGSPEADEDDASRGHGLPAGASAGLIVFHDALYVPASSEGDQPFAVDVLTVHQRHYYESGGTSPPNDYDSPNPVSFLTVRPRVKFLLALSGPTDWTQLAEALLVDALDEWGVGGKTSAGYGRLVRADQEAASQAPTRSRARQAAKPTQPRHQRGERVTVTRVADPSGREKVKFRADDDFLGHFAGEPVPNVAVGETVEVWVANVSPHGYTLTLRPPREKRR